MVFVTTSVRLGLQDLGCSHLSAALPCLKTLSALYSTSVAGCKEAKRSPAGNTDAAHALALPQHKRSRFQNYYQSVLSREMLLKMNAKHFMELPKLRRVDLCIQARDIHRRAFVEKWQMLLHGLGLEYLTGLKPYFSQQHGKQFRGGNVSAVRVTLRGDAMYDFLEKITLLALPSQVGFTGLTTSSIDSEGNLHFKLGNLLNFPDYEENFDVFEDLKSMHITVVLQNTTAQKTHTLLSGFHLPFQAAAVSSDS